LTYNRIFVIIRFVTEENSADRKETLMDKAVLQTLHEPLVVDVPTAMQITTCGRSYLYQLLNDGSIASIKRGKRRLVIYSSLKAFLTAEAAGVQPTAVVQGEWR
jgi:excisionase family DNA binding protein